MTKLEQLEKSGIPHISLDAEYTIKEWKNGALDFCARNPGEPGSHMNGVDDYIRLAGAWGASMEDGDSDTANSLHDRVQEIFRRVCQTNQQNALFDRADTTNDAACFFIASHLKDMDPSRARRLYGRLAHSPLPFVAMSAKHILGEMAPHST